ncbi:MAG: hypothetical protein KDA89_14550 [Planctomycetaceae bacterium]|nr:hypothetical protein [Planctomycetaceae bacterium]
MTPSPEIRRVSPGLVSAGGVKSAAIPSRPVSQTQTPWLAESPSPSTSHCVFALLVSLSICGCSEPVTQVPTPPVLTAETAQEAAETRAAETSENAAAGGLQEFDGLKFRIPEGWEKQQLSPMQAGIITAKFGMPGAGPDVTLTLSRSGGSLDDNLQRWRGQVTASRPEISETVTVAGIESTLIDMEGRFSGGFGREPQDGWQMIGVIVPMKDQGYFLKLTGPAAEVAAVRSAFRDMLDSAE